VDRNLRSFLLTVPHPHLFNGKRDLVWSVTGKQSLGNERVE
jgi:hypothetical protein